MVAVVYHPAALAELQEAGAYYEQQREGLGRRFVYGVERAVKEAAAHPLRWRKLRGPFHRHLVKKFPYGVIYAEEGDRIFILAVMHLRRKPDYWVERVPR